MIFSIYFVTVHTLFYCLALLAKSDSTKTLSAVINSNVEKLYLKISLKEPHVKPDTTADDETRKHICLSITRNAYFDLFAQEDPVEDMTAIYDRLLAEFKAIEVKDDVRKPYLERILKDYEIGPDGSRVFTYQSRPTLMTEGRNEYTFPCVTKMRRTGGFYLYFISDPYDINAALDVPTSHPIEARFLCAGIAPLCSPWILAEEPAINFTTPEYSIEGLENIYWEMRKFRTVAEQESDDPLCKLNKSEKLRSCASVMNSPYFQDKVKFNPHPFDFNERCKLNEANMKTMIGDFHQSEWMLTCSVIPIKEDRRIKTEYFLSRAYQSHHVFVYHYNDVEKVWHIENISARISVVIDDEKTVESSAPSLFQLLEKYKSQNVAEISSD